MTLIDTLVGMAVMATGVVGIMYGFSAMETSAAVSTDQARLQTEMRQLSDFVRSRDSLPYVLCGTSAGYTSVIGAPVNQLFAGGKFLLHRADHDVGEMHLVAGLLLELRRQHGQRLLRCAAAHHMNVCSQGRTP